jgi:hypothetical protein
VPSRQQKKKIQTAPAASQPHLPRPDHPASFFSFSHHLLSLDPDCPIVRFLSIFWSSPVSILEPTSHCRRPILFIFAFFASCSRRYTLPSSGLSYSCTWGALHPAFSIPFIAIDESSPKRTSVTLRKAHDSSTKTHQAASFFHQSLGPLLKQKRICSSAHSQSSFCPPSSPFLVS